ncbi:hypothetical protein pb186bvf_002450 [Paramecium bursaria]
MQNTLKQTAEALLNKASKTYKFEDLIRFGKNPYKNLPEILGQYPNQGVGFKIWRKTWPSWKYIIVKEAEYKSLRNAKFFGVEYIKDKPQSPQPIKIRNGSKRGVWRFDVNGATAFTDNGLKYTTEELQ